MHRKTAHALVVATLAALPMIASAQLTGNVALTSNYKFRGQDQDVIGSGGLAKTKGFKPAIQGGFDYAFGESGWYIGNWNSSVNWLSGNSVEMDFYGGYKMKAGVFDLDFGALTYVYPGNTLGNTTELYAAATYADEAIGAFTLKYSHTVSKDYFGYAGNKAGSGLSGRNTGYLNLAYSKEIVPKVTFKAAVGYTNMSSDIRSLGYKRYVDYNVGAAYDFGSGLSLAGSVQGGNKQSSYQLLSDPGVDFGFGPIGASYYSVNKPRFIVTLTKTL
ncbi:MAG: TorF family putative porin [Gammaproteobacteria bacterium]|nr:TorF family putative porin [Gammaproteobacteria bacterium]MBU1442008.1 TorF family putative porin [Gammaproteobacteria bacterium]MBU2286659.1 TorF family putative porin [Gammaproteobacteria bacterium]MBU2407283.1 TorF family putative porin [Gammaproteobacteria bacterium]